MVSTRELSFVITTTGNRTLPSKKKGCAVKEKHMFIITERRDSHPITTKKLSDASKLVPMPTNHIILRGSRRSGLIEAIGPDSVYEWRGDGALVASNTYPSFPSTSHPSLRDSYPSSAWPSTSLFGDVCRVFMWPPVGSSWHPPSALRSWRRAYFIA